MKRIIDTVRDISVRIHQKNINAYAACTAFFLFVSLIPMLILLFEIVPYTPLTEGDLMKAATEIMPDAIHPLIISIISDVYHQSAGILPTAAIATFWSAGKGVLALMQGLNAINGTEETRNAFLARLIASFYTVIMLAALLLSLLIMVFGNVLIDMTVKSIPQLNSFFSFLVHFRYLILGGVISLALALIYAYIPGVKTKLWMQLPGAALAAWAWSLSSFGFSIYVDYFNGFSMYGSLTTIVMIMIWLYIGVYVIMLGAYLNKYFRPFYMYVVERKKENQKERIRKKGRLKN